jgi:Chaperone of endosialidase
MGLVCRQWGCSVVFPEGWERCILCSEQWFCASHGSTVTGLRGLDVGEKPIRVYCAADALVLQRDTSITKPVKFALASELALTNKDSLVVNYQGSYKDGVRIEGNVQITGTLTHASSIALKENIAELSGQEAMATLQGLNAVKYNYKADEQKEQRIGFIAEEVPDLVASAERDRLSPMDLIAVLTKAVQEQQKVISTMADEMSNLKTQLGGLS